MYKNQQWMNPKPIFFILFFILLSFITFESRSEDLFKIHFKVEKFTLKNGLKVLLYENHNIPMVSYHTWYGVGSRDEKIGVTGAAHMLEHMMFKGAKKYSGKQFDEILHQNGITNNAFTTTDYTGFYENLPSSKLELIMDAEVDRMKDLAIRPEDLASELEVVGEERRWRVDNNPVSLLRENLMEKLYLKHPYRWPTIGYMKDIQKYTSEKLREFYNTYYVPNNAVVVIAGDISVEKAKSLVTKYYSSLEAHPLPARVYSAEDEIQKERRFEIKSEVKISTISLTYPGVATGHPDGFALDLLANILGAGSSSRLYKKIVYQNQIATSSSAYDSTSQDPGYFSMFASMKPGQPTYKAEKIFDEEILKLQKTLPSDLELRKAKNQIMKEFVDELQTIDGRAEMLAINELVRGDYQKMFEDLENYEKVTRQDIRRVARKYLNSKKRVVGILNPNKESTK